MPTAEELRKASESQAAKLRSAAEDPSNVKEFGQQFAAGVLDVPESVYNMIRKYDRASPVGAAARLARWMTGGGEEDAEFYDPGEPATLGGEMGEMAGFAAGLAPILGGGLSKVPAAAETAAKVPAFLQNLGRAVGQSYQRAPKKFTGVEAALGASAGAGGYAAEQMFPDSDGAKVIGQIAGGVGPGAVKGATVATAKGVGNLATKLPTVRYVVNFGKDVIKRIEQNTSMGPGTGRAIERVERATPSPKEAGAAMDEPLVPGAKLSPAAQTGDQGLLSLEKSVLKESDQLQRQVDEDIAATNQAIRESMNLGGSPDVTADTFESARGYLTNLLDQRFRVAAQRADERIAKLRPETSEEVANRIVSDELDKAVTAGRAQERQLYNQIPQETPVPTSNSARELAEETMNLSQAQQSDIPSIAKRWLNPQSPDYLGDVTTIKELRGLQSKLREQARIARSNNKFNRARVADNIADSITEDIANAQGAAELVNTAVAFSRNLNTKLNQGSVSKILGRNVGGARNVPESLTLEKTMGTGPQARQTYDELVKALDADQSPEALNQAVGDFLTSKFFRSAVKGDQLNTESARRFMVANQDVLERLPNLRQQFQDAIDANDLVALRQRQINRLDPKKSRAVLFIQKGPDAAFDDILKSREPGKAISNLINQAARDKTGQAQQGLKSSFFDYLLKKSEVSAADVADQPFISGARLNDLLSEKNMKVVANRLLDEGERRRLQRIVNTAQKLDKWRKATPSTEGVLGDQLGKGAEAIAGLLGAAAGRNTARNLGVGGTVQIPGIMANRFRELLRAGVNDPSRRLLEDAIQDESLFRALLQAEKVDDGRIPKEATRRLNAWAAGVLAQQEDSNRTGT